jgi:hypothetical protein
VIVAEGKVGGFDSLIQRLDELGHVLGESIVKAGFAETSSIARPAAIARIS